MSVLVKPVDTDGLRWAQRLVAERHYLYRPVDARCSPLAYRIGIEGDGGEVSLGCLIFGRPEATRCREWYGSVSDMQEGRCEVTRWQVINLARVFIFPRYQGAYANKRGLVLPGYTDRKGVWRSTLASTAVATALDRVVLDYLLARPPCFPDEPYELRWCLSYCDTNVHRGALYRAAGFDLYRTNGRGVQTWRKALRVLAAAERDAVLLASERSERSRRYRASRGVEQLRLPLEVA